MNPLISMGITDEQLKFLTLDYLSLMDALDEEVQNLHREGRQIATDILVLDIITEFAKEGNMEFTQEEVVERMMTMITLHMLDNLTKMGIIEQSFNDDGEAQFSLTEEGHNMTTEMLLEGLIRDNILGQGPLTKKELFKRKEDSE